MNENLFHAGALAMFVVLCIGAASQGEWDQASHVAAQRVATMAAHRTVRSVPVARLATLRSDIGTVAPQ